MFVKADCSIYSHRSLMICLCLNTYHPLNAQKMAETWIAGLRRLPGGGDTDFDIGEPLLQSDLDSF